MSRCHNCQRDPDEWDRELRRLEAERDAMRSSRNSARADTKATEESLERVGVDRDHLQALYDNTVDDLGVIARQLNKAELERDDARRLLGAVVTEADFVISGGDNPDDACSECGCAGYGMLRDALTPAREALAKFGKAGR